MAKKAKKEKSERITRKQRKNLQKSSFSDDPEDLDSQLKSLELCTKNIAGDGNCLFRSLSDQYYGHDANHKAIRQQVCQFLRDNKETYQYFVEDDKSFEHHVDCMSRNATYGGNMELAAFAKMEGVDIKVYQPGLIYIIHGKEENEKDETTVVLHIAYHSWEHYSSVRNIDGPFSGPPEIQAKVKEDESIQEEEELTSQEKVVLNACPETKIRTIRRLLRKYKGNPDDVINAIYESQYDQDDQQKEDYNVAQEHEHVEQDSQQKEGLNVDQDAQKKEGLIVDQEHENIEQDAQQKEGLDVEQDLQQKEGLSVDQDAKQKEDLNIEQVDGNTEETIQQKEDLDVDQQHEEESYTMQEQDILDSHPDTPLEKVRRLLEKHNGNLDDVSVELKNCKDDLKESKAVVAQSNIQDLVNTLVVQDKVNDKAEEIKKLKIKKLSARDRKELAKKKQKEEKVIKQREKAARKKQHKKDDQEEPCTKSVSKVISAMKEINI